MTTVLRTNESIVYVVAGMRHLWIRSVFTAKRSLGLIVKNSSESVPVVADTDCYMVNGLKKSKKKYRLLDPNGVKYTSNVPGKFGGYRPKKIYGRLDCPSALRWLEKGHYAQHRVFFLTEEDAIAVGYHPCAVCMKK